MMNFKNFFPIVIVLAGFILPSPVRAEIPDLSELPLEMALELAERAEWLLTLQDTPDENNQYPDITLDEDVITVAIYVLRTLALKGNPEQKARAEAVLISYYSYGESYRANNTPKEFRDNDVLFKSLIEIDSEKTREALLKTLGSYVMIKKEGRDDRRDYKVIRVLGEAGALWAAPAIATFFNFAQTSPYYWDGNRPIQRGTDMQIRYEGIKTLVKIGGEEEMTVLINYLMERPENGFRMRYHLPYLEDILVEELIKLNSLDIAHLIIDAINERKDENEHLLFSYRFFPAITVIVDLCNKRLSESTDIKRALSEKIISFLKEAREDEMAYRRQKISEWQSEHSDDTFLPAFFSSDLGYNQELGLAVFGIVREIEESGN